MRAGSYPAPFGLTLLLLLIQALPAAAQTLWVGGAVGWDVHRFAEDATPNRLDGAAMGWTVQGGLVLPKHITVSAEWTDAGEIEDLRTTTVDIGGRPVAISSSFSHRTRAAGAFAGYEHRIARLRLMYLFGLTFTTVQREFATNASGLVLVSPSSPPPATRVTVNDSFAAAAVGVQALVTLTPHVLVLAGVRFQRLHLDPDLSGWSVRSVIGAGWAF